MFTIGSLEGYFDGYNFHQGPVSFDIDDKTIANIRFETDDNAKVKGAGKILSIPFNDGHTHLAFSGDRFFELDYKIQGKSYNEILEAGGGIKHTVKNTRRVKKEELLKLILNRLNTMLSHGSLVVESKSGYGLSLESEIKLLEVLNAANKEHFIDVHPTFGAAHVYPDQSSKENYLNLIIEEMLPWVTKHNLATTTDVFCDKGAFSVEEACHIFEASLNYNLPIRVHAEELEYTGIGKIAAKKYKARSADHLLHAKFNDFKTLAKYGTVAMFMPLAPLGLFSSNKPTDFGKSQVTVGLGSDFNPNNWAVSMQTAIRMAVFTYGMRPLNAFKAATSGSFLGITGKVQKRIDNDSNASFIILKAKTLSEVCSKFGQNLVDSVYKKGEKIHQNNILVS